MIKKILFSVFVVITLSACSLFQNFSQSIINDDDQAPIESTSDSGAVIPSQEGDESDTEALPGDNLDIPEANPLSLSIRLDETLAVEAEIGPEGGSLEVTTGEGGLFRLEIPAGALIGPETIRMIPLSSIEGLPVESGQGVGVRLEPTGMVFFKPATLTIEQSGADDGTIPLGFGTMSEGEDFHLQLAQSDGNESRLFLLHFSNYGVMRARQEEIGRLNELYSPSTAQNYAVDQTMVIIKLVDDPEAQLDAYEKILRQWFNNSLITRIQNAAVFDDRLEAAVGEYLAWENMIEMFDLVYEFEGQLAERLSSEIEEALDGLAAAFITAFDRAYSRCLQDNEPEEAFRMHRYGLTASHLELWGRAGLDEAETKRKLQSCFSFEFVLRSKVEGGADGGEKVSQVLARIPLKYDNVTDFDIGGAIIVNEGSLDFEINTISPMHPNCHLSGKSGQVGVSLIAKLNYSLYQPWSIKEVKTFLIFSERPEEIITCTVQGITTSTPILWWRPLFQVVNEPFFDGPFMEISLPIENRGDTFAEIELYGPIPQIPNGQERTKYELLHKPGE